MSAVVAIIQARMASTRLPGKVIMDIAGKPMLARVLERVRLIPGIDRVVAATSTRPEDRQLVQVAAAYNAQTFAGSAEDVLDRYYQAALFFAADVVVRLTGDCPLLDPEVSGRVVERYRSADVDYVSNTHPPTFPDGLDTEVFSFAALEAAWREAHLPSEREHVTSYIWKNSERFRLANVVSNVDLSHLRWTVDEPQDLELVRALAARLPTECAYSFKSVLRVLDENPQLANLNRRVGRDEGYLKSLSKDRIQPEPPHVPRS